MAYNDPYRHSRAGPEAPYEDHNPPSNPGYQISSSTEKMVDQSSMHLAGEMGEDQYGHGNAEGTERAQKGRQGLQAPPMTWAEMGPPPRSTGILRMWRKDERGKQWSRVCLPLQVVAYRYGGDVMARRHTGGAGGSGRHAKLRYRVAVCDRLYACAAVA